MDKIDKDELIKAAEMVKKYCESRDCDTCPMNSTCTFYLYTHGNLAVYMKEFQKCLVNDVIDELVHNIISDVLKND